MWRSYLLAGLRSLAKSRTYAAINIVGLALGIAACLTILLFVRYEFGYDRWLPGAADTYQLQTWSSDQDSGEILGLQQSQYVAGRALKKDFPQVEDVVFVLSPSMTALRDNQPLRIDDAFAVDGPFFDVVDLPLARGDKKSALAEVGSAVISERQARQMFGTTDVIGRTLTLVDGDEREIHRITGVLRDLPRNSHMKTDLIVRFDPGREFATRPEFLTGWGDISGYNYVRLRPGSDPRAIAAAMPAWEKRNIPDTVAEPGDENPGKSQDWTLVNVRDVHLSQADGAMVPGSERSTLVTFAIVAMLILAMACTNFVNLATARAGQRAREVALRKVLGATRTQLVTQFLAESTLIAAIATLVGLAATELLLGPVNGFLGVEMRLHYLGADSILIAVVVLALAVGLVAGLYPAFFLSRFQPSQVLKANQSTAEPSGSGRLRNMLVIGQFAVSTALIICTLIVYLQTAYARQADPGFRREGLMQVGLGDERLRRMGETLTDQVERIDGVRSAAVTSLGIATRSHMGRAVYLPGQDKPVGIGNYAVSSHFFDTVGLKLLAGRLLDPKRELDVLSVPESTDSAGEAALARRGGNVVINQAAAHKLGFRTPAEAVGRQVRVGLFMGDDKPQVPVTIVGVVSDARFRSVRESVDDVMWRLGTDYVSHLVLRYDTARPLEVRERVEALWKRLAPETPISARFSEEIIDDLYRAEDARGALFAGFALLAIVIGCLGLFGLAAFTAQRRTKEIGLRKVLGARTADILRLLMWQFSRPVLIANLIAWPAAWWVMRAWLNRFDARIDLDPLPFIAAAALGMAIAAATIGAHAWRVARTNPIHALRYE
jgi:putative ABC transport system permease protein